MRIDLDAKVRTRDGEDAGSVQRAIFDPNTNRVSDFVVSTGGLLGKSVVVPVEELEKASRDGEVLRLDLTKDELDHMPAYVPENYGAPPANWIAPTGYGFPAGWYLWPSTYSYVPAPAELPETRPAEPMNPMIDKGAAVVDADGEEVGTVQDVRLDPDSGDLRGLVIKAGGLFDTLLGRGEVLDLTIADVDQVERGIVRLRDRKEDLKHRGVKGARDGSS